MLSKLFFVLAVAVSAVTFRPQGEPQSGFTAPWMAQTMENDDDEVDLHAVVSDDDVPDPTVHQGEDIELEQADDEALKFHIGHRQLKMEPAKDKDLQNEDLW